MKTAPLVQLCRFSAFSASGLLAMIVLGAAQLSVAGAPWYTEGDFAPVQRVEVMLTNELDFDRLNSPVAIRRDQFPVTDLHELTVTVVDPSLPPAPEPTAEQLKMVGGHGLRAESNGHALFRQLDDIDKDGVWDELFFVTDIKAGETKTLYVYLGFSQRGWNPHETHAGIGSYARHVVPFWESKNVGWKLWFPTSVDVYGKRKPMLMSQRLYMDNLDGYAVTLIDSAMGCDIMSVDNSFGGGAICLFEDPSQPARVSVPRFTPASGNAKMQELKFNAGQQGDTRYAFDVVVNGPMRSMIRVKTMHWESGRGSYEVEQLYTAYARQNYSTCRVKFSKFEPKHAGTVFGAGIRKKPEENFFLQEGTVVITSGPEKVMDPDEGKVSWRVDFIANALIVKESFGAGYRYTPDLQGNHTFAFPVRDDATYEYMIAASWSEGPELNTLDAFKSYVLKTATGYNHPLRIRCGDVEER